MGTIGRVRDELRQSSDRETNVRAQAHKAVKEAEEKLQAEVTAHKRTMEFHRQENRERSPRGAENPGTTGGGEKTTAVVQRPLGRQRRGGETGRANIKEPDRRDGGSP